MLNTMTARAARDNFTDLLGAVYYGREEIAVEKKGRIFAIVINPDEYQTFQNLKKAAKTKLFGLIDDLQKPNQRKKLKDVIKDVTAEVEAIRS